MGDHAVELDLDLEHNHTQTSTETQILNYIRTHPAAEALAADPEFTEITLHLDIPPNQANSNLITGALAGPKKLLMSPFLFRNSSERSIVMFAYMGSGVCGHPGIVHGGILATLVDEGLARCCFPDLPNKVGVTANLNIDYRAPAPANSYAVFRARTVRLEGRKAWVEGRIESLPAGDDEEPVLLVEAKALFIEPKGAAVCDEIAGFYVDADFCRNLIPRIKLLNCMEG